MMGARNFLFASFFLSTLVLLVPGSVAAQIVEEDLPPESFTELAYEGYDSEDLTQRFVAAEAAYLEALEPGRSLAAFDELVSILTSRQEGGPLPAVERDLLGRSHAYRARIHFYLGDDAAVLDSLAALLEADPRYVFDEAVVSPKLLERYQELRDQRLGTLELSVEPQDAEVLIDGQRVDLEEAGIPVPAARTLRITAQRPGYAAIDMPIEVEAGGRLPLELVMERDSAMLRLVTRPTGAKVTLDGAAVGTTDGVAPAGYPLVGDAVRYAPKEFSAPLNIGGIAPGNHVLEVSKPGYRTYRVQVGVPELRDYDAGAVVLQRTEGQVVLRRLPEGAQVTLDGRAIRPEVVNSSDGRLTLPPGSYRLSILDGPRGIYEADFDLVDRQNLELEIRLTPGLALLGVLGGDRVTAGRLQEALRTQSADLEGWRYLDRSETGQELLQRFGGAVDALRSAAATGRGSAESLDWEALQRLADERSPAAVYAVAVLSDDLVATHADLWFLPAGPAPARPDRRRIEIDRPQDLAAVVDAFRQPIEVRRSWFGALLVDVGLDAPMIFDVTPESPAGRAGLVVGDRLVQIFDRPILTAAEAWQQLSSRDPLSSVSLTVESAAGRRTVDLRLGTSYLMVPLKSPEVVYAAVSAVLARAQADAGDNTPVWVLELNQAAVYLNGAAWADAVRVLRRIRAPAGGGLGQGTVDYWLGVALQNVGPEYSTQARAALQRAAAQPGARLLHADGPLVSPRAQARLGVAAP
ncbi:MAG: PEGA domain-containing protein [Acidobacteriota bacterium]